MKLTQAHCQEIKAKEVKKEDVRDVFKHLSVQSMLGLKSLYGRVVIEDVLSIVIASTYAFCLCQGSKPVCLVLLVKNKNNDFNLFLIFTSRFTKCYNEIKEEINKILDSIEAFTIDTIVYEGSSTERRQLKDLGFKETNDIYVSIEGKKHITYRK